MDNEIIKLTQKKIKIGSKEVITNNTSMWLFKSLLGLNTKDNGIKSGNIKLVGCSKHPFFLNSALGKKSKKVLVQPAGKDFILRDCDASQAAELLSIDLDAILIVSYICFKEFRRVDPSIQYRPRIYRMDKGGKITNTLFQKIFPQRR